MPKFFFIPRENKAYKVETDKDNQTYAYHVQIFMRAESGAFIHARGRDMLGDEETAARIITAMGGLPSTSQKYMEMLKDYFAADKKVREWFIKTYNL